MPQLTTKALEKRLKAARKELRAAKTKMIWNAISCCFFLFPNDRQLYKKSTYLAKKNDSKIYNIEKTLEARKRVIASYHDYKKGDLSRDFVIFNYLQYLYFREKLTKKR